MFKQRQAGTGQWLLDNPDFLEWVKGSREFRWYQKMRDLCFLLLSP